MIVYGVQFPDNVLDKAWENAVTRGLSYAVLTRELARLGYEPGYRTARAADRLLQKKRKAGVVKYEKGKWALL